MTGFGASLSRSWQNTVPISRKCFRYNHGMSCWPTPTLVSLYAQAGPSRPISTTSFRHYRPVTGLSPHASHSISFRSRLVILPRTPLPHVRHDSTASSTPAITPVKSPTHPPIDPTTTVAPTTSLLQRITSTISLTPVESPGQRSEAGHGSSSVAKLVQLAKPEGRQLRYAIGLVSICASSSRVRRNRPS